MNIEIEKTFSFNSILVLEDQHLWINPYEARIIMRIVSRYAEEYNTAYSRMQFWFNDIMNQAVLIESQNPLIDTWRETGTRCIDFPTPPVDQVLGLMLMSKLRAIVDGRIEILHVGVSSAADDFVMYFCDSDDSLHWFDKPGWWSDEGPVYATTKKHTRKTDKIISLSRGAGWKDHGLEWPAQENTGNVSILTNPDKND